VHFGFATFTQVPKDFDDAVGGRFVARCLNWLAGRSPDVLPPARNSAAAKASSKGP
jgi:hypothetical protein